MRWLEGKIAREEGDLVEAEAALREARDAFLQEGIAVDAALVSLDLAVLHARRGDTAKIRQLASEMLPIFEAGGVHPDAMAALLLFQRAAEAEEVTLDLVDQIAASVRRALGGATSRDISATWLDIGARSGERGATSGSFGAT